ncbi:hypothetical protein [Priestia endophytica]|uniref:hypothetical protein n=1 Tax=Priestia endophytica TaxID=135735 RepID=UPI00227E70C2|nr:hypothetical protein [Priestia endophytica]MCY8235541.1 hypothetical protein [Priestia endophytica]
MAVNEIVEGKKYLLRKVHQETALTYQPYASYDYVKLSGDSKSGTPVIFEQHPDKPGEYYIKMTSCNWSGSQYFTRSGKGWVYLDTKANASRFCFFLDAWGRIKFWHSSGNEDTLNFKLHTSGDTKWLSTDGYKRYLKDDEPNTRTGEREVIDRDLFEVKEA